MRLVALLALPLAACSYASSSEMTGTKIAASGSGATRSYAVDDFSKVQLRGSDDVDVRVGTGFSVRAEGPSEELDKLEIVRDGDQLKVGRKSQSGISWGSHAKVKVYVTMPRIAAASVAGSGDMAIDRAEGSSFDASVAGSGDLAVAALAVDRASLNIAGSGGLSAAGTTRTLNVSIAGSGDVSARGLKAASASVSIMGSGNLAAAVEGPAKVTIMGSGDAALGPKAQCTTTKMGSGSVTCS